MAQNSRSSVKKEMQLTLGDDVDGGVALESLEGEEGAVLVEGAEGVVIPPSNEAIIEISEQVTKSI